MAKRGPKPKIDARVEGQILAIIKTGGSIRDAVDCVGIGYQTLVDKRKKDPEFRNRLIRAVMRGKLLHIRKIGKAKQWQASAFMLERRWSNEYGRKDKVNKVITGKHGGAVKSETTVKHTIDYAQLARDLEAFAVDNARGRVSENGN